MSNAPEQEWWWDDGAGPGIRERRGSAPNDRGRRVLRGEPTTTASDIALAVAAPDMARALLEVRDAILSGALSEDAPEAIERALRKAGVLP